MSHPYCLTIIIIFQTVLAAWSVPSQASVASEYAGRYTDGRDFAVYFEETPYGLSIRPVMWTATQLLVPSGKDKFAVIDRRTRHVEFERDAAGHVSGVTIAGMDGEGLELKRASGPLLPVELVLSGRPDEAAAAYLRRRAEGSAAALETASQVLKRLPTQTQNALRLLKALEGHFRSDVRYHALLGYAFVQAGDRRAALAAFERAHKLDSSNAETISGLARLGSPTSRRDAPGWQVPFPLNAVFANPTATEIRSVEADWKTRDLSARDVREEFEDTVLVGERNARIRIVSHLVHGSRHYGAIVYPADARPGSCPVIVVAKGVSPTYFPLELRDQPEGTFMGELSPQLVFVYPSFRGEVLKFKDKTFTSEGDRRDALDGATDDALELLNVTLKTTPAADPTRICVYGHSRGGNVALLAGIRDERIDCVVDLAGPTDWFYLMGTNGWTEEELWREAVRTHASPVETGGQNLERFLMKAIEGKASAAAVRHNMIASSPIYFAHRIPLTQMHYGLEDPFVPVRNGREFVAALRRRRVPASRYEAFFYPGQGHDTDRIAAPRAARTFIARALGLR